MLPIRPLDDNAIPRETKQGPLTLALLEPGPQVKRLGRTLARRRPPWPPTRTSAAMVMLAALVLLQLSHGVACSRAQQDPQPGLEQQGAGDDVHSAVFVLTQDGLNNAPELYSQFLADAIADANRQVRFPPGLCLWIFFCSFWGFNPAQMRAPHFWCDVTSTQNGCSGCLCQIKNQGVDVAVHMDMVTGRSPVGAAGSDLYLN